MAKALLATCLLVSLTVAYLSSASFGQTSPTFSLSNIGTTGGTFSNPSQGSYTVNGKGDGLKGTSDSFTFVNLRTYGTAVEMITKVNTQQNTSPSAVGGLMLRESLSANSAHVAVTVSPQAGISFVYRTSTGGTTTTSLGQTIAAPVWLRIVRSSNSFAGYYSTTGYDWILAGKCQIDMAQTYYVGFPVASKSASTSTVAFVNSIFMQDVPQRSEDMLLWLRGDSGVQVSGSNVTAWGDQSGMANSASQGTTANQPVVTTNAINGLPAINFTGSKWFQLPEGFSDFSKGMTVFAVVAPPSSVSTDARIFDLATAANQNNLQLYHPGSASSISFKTNPGGAIVTTTGVTPSSFQVMEVVHDGTRSASLYLNGVLKSTNDAMESIPIVTRTGNFIGKSFTSANFFEGKIAELIVIKRAYSDAERKRVENYLAYKYQIGTPLPVPPTISATLGGSVITPATGVYAGTLTGSNGVTMSVYDPLSTTVIKYTEDGTDPTPSSNTYTAMLPVTTSKVFKAIAIEGGHQSAVVTAYVQVGAGASSDNVSRNGLRTWLKTDWDKLVELSGSNVTKWNDISGSDLHASQSTSGNRPTLSTGGSGINGVNAVTFNGTNQWLQIPRDYANMNGGASIFVITQPTAVLNARLLDLGLNTTTDNIQLYVSDNNPATIGYRVYNSAGTGTVVTAATTSAVKQLLEVVHSGGTATIFKDGTQLGQNTVMNAVSNVNRTGNFLGKAYGSTNYFTGKIAEILIYDRPVSSNERLGIEAYCSAKYGTPQPTLAAPIITPPTSVFAGSAMDFSIAAGNGATIHYEYGANPANPTTGSPVYSAPVHITGTTIVKAIAAKTNFTTSPVAYSKIQFDSSGGGMGDPILWLRDTGLPATSPIDVWTDATPKGNSATQSNASLRPARIASAINGLPAADFVPGTPNWMQFPSGMNDFSNGLTFFMVAKPDAAGSQARLFDWGTAASANNIQLYMSNANTITYRVYNGTQTSLDAPIDISTPHYYIISVVHSGTNATLYLTDNAGNKTPVTSTTMNTIPNVARTNFLGKAYGNTNYFDGQIAEMVVYDKALSSEDREEVERSLIARYNLAVPVAQPTISPPAGAWPAGTKVSISVADPGAQIFWSDDGNPPTTLYTGPIEVLSSKKIIAKAMIGTRSSLPTTAYIQIDNNTKDLPRDGMVLWLKADNNDVALPIAPPTSPVSAWNDVSGKNNDATQGTGSAQPTVVTNAVNSLPVVSFSSASSQFLQLPSGMADFTQGMSMFVVTKPTGTSSTFVDFANIVSSSAQNNITLSQASTNQSILTVLQDAASSSITASAGITSNQYQLIEASHTGRQAATLLKNGVETKELSTIKNPNIVTRDSNLIGKHFSGTPLQGQIAEIILYNKELTPDQRRSVEQYLVGRYALSSIPIRPTITTSGVYSGNKLVTIAGFPGDTLRYTTDGSTPTTSSTIYSGSFTVTESTVVRAIAVHSGNSSLDTTEFIQIEPVANMVPRTGLLQWLKSDFGVVQDGTKASFWSDMCGSGRKHDASQAAGANQPLYDTTVGFPKVTTEQTPRYMTLAPGFADLAGGFTFFAVTRPLTGTGTDCRLFTVQNGTTSDNVEFKNNPASDIAKIAIRQGGGAQDLFGTSNGAFPLNKFQIYEVTHNGANSGKIYIDSDLKATDNALTNPSNITRLLNRLGTTSAATDFYAGDFTEILFYSRLLSDQERMAVENYLSQKYQVPAIGTVAAPIVKPSGGTYTAPLEVAIVAPEGTTVYFTQDNSTPTTGSTVYQKPIPVYFTQTIKAIAVSKTATSAVSTAQTYTLDSAQWPAPSASDTTPLQLQLQLPNTTAP